MRQPGRRGETDATGEAFWRFSLALYARPGAAEALIALQDRAGCDVNLVLFALWAGGVRGTRLDGAALDAAEAAIGGLRRDVVAPLRALRRRVKTEPDDEVQALHRKILGLELAAERRAQRRLARLASASANPEADRLATSDANLALYLGAEAESPEADVLRAAIAGLGRRS